MLVSYRPTNEVDYRDYVPCDACYAYIQKRELWRHRCKLRAKPTGRVAAAAALFLPTPSGMTKPVKLLIDGMMNPEIKLVISNDGVIKSLATRMFDKHSLDKRAYIRSQVTLLVRLKLKLRKKSSNATLKDCLCPSRLKDVVEAVRSTAGFCEKTGQFGTSLSALKLGHMLKKCAKVVKSDAIMRDKSMIEDADFFHQLRETEWADEVSSKALKTVITRRRNKIQLLPLSEDESALHSYLSTEIKRWTSILEA